MKTCYTSGAQETKAKHLPKTQYLWCYLNFITFLLYKWLIWLLQDFGRKWLNNFSLVMQTVLVEIAFWTQCFIQNCRAHSIKFELWIYIINIPSLFLFSAEINIISRHISFAEIGQSLENSQVTGNRFN